METTVLAVKEVDTSNVSSDNGVSSLQSADVDNDVLTTSDNFDNLQSAIKTAYANGNCLKLESNYQYTESNDNYDGVTITNDNFVLDGNGHIIDVNIVLLEKFIQ